MAIDRMQFFLDNVTAGFDKLGLTVIWRSDSGDKIEASVSNLMYSYSKMKDKIELLSAIIDVWKVGRMVEMAAQSDLITMSRVDFDKVDKLFITVKMELKKLFTDVNNIDVYEIDMVKLDTFNERIMKLKVV